METQDTLQIKIEYVRKQLDEEAKKDLSSEKCMNLSLVLDRLIEQYMALTGQTAL